nr:hypothetical protein [Edaphocola aurantiacus]
MKRLLLHIIIVLFILDTTSLYQVFKVPSLISHYTDHKTRNPAIGFMDFLSMHYWGEDINDNDDEKDMQLPFKKIDIQQTCFLFIPQKNIATIDAVTWPEGRNYGLMRSQTHFNTVLGTLFRPPQA